MLRIILQNETGFADIIVLADLIEQELQQSKQDVGISIGRVAQFSNLRVVIILHILVTKYSRKRRGVHAYKTYCVSVCFVFNA